MHARALTASLLVSSLHLIGAADALACVCTGVIPTIEARIAHAPMVVAARLTAVEPLTDSAGRVTRHIAAIRVEVLDVVRGDVTAKELRIWDQFVGTSCSLELSDLKVGTLLIIAVDPSQERLQEFWKEIGIRPEPSDFVFGSCQPHWRTFRTESDLRRYARERS